MNILLEICNRFEEQTVLHNDDSDTEEEDSDMESNSDESPNVCDKCGYRSWKYSTERCAILEVETGVDEGRFCFDCYDKVGGEDWLISQEDEKAFELKLKQLKSVS